MSNQSVFVISVPNYVKLLEAIREAGFPIRDDDWKMHKKRVAVTMPNRHWGHPFIDAINGLELQDVSRWNSIMSQFVASEYSYSMLLKDSLYNHRQ